MGASVGVTEGVLNLVGEFTRVTCRDGFPFYANFPLKVSNFRDFDPIRCRRG